MFGLALAASSACIAASCAAPADDAGAEPAALAAMPNVTISSEQFAPISGRSGLGDVLGLGWTSSSADLGGNASLQVSVYDARRRTPAGARAPIPDLTSDQPSLRLNLTTQVVSARAGDLTFDFGPRAGLSTGPEGRSAGAGVFARLGQNFDRPRGDGEGAWYFFAGAGARAVKFDPEADYFGLTEPRVERQTIVGDAQAGVAFDMGPADLAVAYVRRDREAASQAWGMERTDGFAVVSMSWRH